MNNRVNALNLSNVLEVALSTKTALFEEWTRCGEKFVDKNHMMSEGLIPQSIGVASALLLLVVFGDNKNIFPDGEKADINVKVGKMINTMLDMVEKEGYSITPYKKAEVTKGLFGEYGYTDVMTWVSSSCILARYAQRKGVLSLQEDLRDRLLHIGADTLLKLLKGQREDGTWGFRADAGNPSRGSLYFTYAVNAALADFFNYALGEIDEVEKSNDAELLGGGRDDKFIDYLNDKGGFEDVVEAVNQARIKVQNWLIKNCLPLLPRLATCKNLTDEEKEILSIGKKKNISEYEYNYFNLYHTYYLIDMLIDGAADIRYESIIDNEEEFEALKKFYGVGGKKEDMKLPVDDLYYYFIDENGKNAKNFCREYVAQAIHSARTSYMNASRTRYAFWIGNSEFEIEWEYGDDHEIMQQVAGAKVDIKEPALVPMALRVNVQYCYYVSGQPDKVVDDMFDKIMGDRYVESGDSACVTNLWDNENYNLLITERAIEAIIDSYDYVCKYEKQEESVGTPAQAGGGLIEEYIANLVDKRIENALKNVLTAESVENTVNACVEKQLSSKSNVDVEALVNSAVEKRLASLTPASSSCDMGDIIAKLGEVATFVKTDIPSGKGESEKEKLAYEFLKFFMAMQNCANRATVAKQGFLAGEKAKDGNELFTVEDDRTFRRYTEGAIEKMESFEARFPNLFNAFVTDISRNDSNYLINLYSVLKELLNQQK